MKKLLFVVVLILICLGGIYAKQRFYDPRHQLQKVTEQVDSLERNSAIKNGDIIFQTSLSKQSRAIQLATHSKYSHCGIIYKINNDYFVYEAVQPVKLTPIAKWVNKGDEGHFVIKRLKNANTILTPNTLEKMKEAGNSFKGKNYDIYFDWSDDKIYCSELIWKIYKRGAGIEVGKLQRLKDFDLSNPIVKQTMQKRYGDHVPLNETVISPVSIFNSDLLITVANN